MIGYNEHDRFAAAWLRELIAAGELPAGDVDERSIEELEPGDCGETSHFFAGIGGWPYALRLAGWPDDRPVWTGSCPCQFGSTAARGRNNAHDLWPAWRTLLDKCRPPIVFGEQIPHRDWADRTASDLLDMGYQVEISVLCASLVGLPPRRRLYFAAIADSKRQRLLPVDEEVAGLPEVARERVVRLGMGAARDGVPNRVGRLRGYGNAIVPQVAAAFVRAAMDAA